MLDRPAEVRLGEIVFNALRARGVSAAFDNGEINRTGKRFGGEFRFSVVTCTFAGKPFVISIQHQEDTPYTEDGAYSRTGSSVQQSARPAGAEL